MLSNFDRFAVELFKELKSYWGGADRQVLSYTKKKNRLHK